MEEFFNDIELWTLLVLALVASTCATGTILFYVVTGLLYTV